MSVYLPGITDPYLKRKNMPVMKTGLAGIPLASQNTFPLHLMFDRTWPVATKMFCLVGTLHKVTILGLSCPPVRHAVRLNSVFQKPKGIQFSRVGDCSCTNVL